MWIIGSPLDNALAVLAFGIVCLLLPLYQARAEARFGEIWAFRAVGAVWPILGFLLSFALITSRETVPFLYFQF